MICDLFPPTKEEKVWEQKKAYTVSTPDAIVVLSQTVYTGCNKATIENHLKFLSICHK